jgi:hypothetical protein
LARKSRGDARYSPKCLEGVCSEVPHSLCSGVVGSSIANKIEEAITTGYLSEEEQRQRVRELVRKKTGVDWPTLKVIGIEKSMSSVTLFYWPRKEDVGKHGYEQLLELTDEEADSIAIG